MRSEGQLGDCAVQPTSRASLHVGAAPPHSLPCHHIVDTFNQLVSLHFGILSQDCPSERSMYSIDTQGLQPRPAKRVRVLGPVVQDSFQPGRKTVHADNVIDLTAESPTASETELDSKTAELDQYSESLCCYGVVSIFFRK